MNFFKRLFLGAEGLPPLPEPKVPSGTFKTVSPFLGSSKGSTISNAVSNITNLDLVSHVRNEGTMNQVIKKLVLTSPDLSHAVEVKIKSALSKSYTAIAVNETGRVDPAATEAVNSVLQRLNLGSIDYTRYSPQVDLRAISATLLLDSYRYGAMCLEVVLDKTRVPHYLKPVSSRLLDWMDDEPNTYPVYKGKNVDIPLNYPTIIYSSSTQDPETAYADSPLQTAIQACLWDADFVNDLRRAATKNLLQRLKIVINSEKFISTLPVEVKVDPVKQQEYMDSLVTKLEDQLGSLSPEDSLVIFDILEADTIADGNRSEDRSISVLQSLINGKIAAGAKILPSIVGRGESSSAASTESLLFLKSIASSQLELNNLISRALTLAVRLLGHDAYVNFEFEEVNLRPGLELESFKAIKQARILENLSLGLMTDERACILLTGALPPAGYKSLSGTMFKYGAADTTNNDYSNTSVSNDGKPDSTQSQKESEAETPGVKSKKK